LMQSVKGVKTREKKKKVGKKRRKGEPIFNLEQDFPLKNCQGGRGGSGREKRKGRGNLKTFAGVRFLKGKKKVPPTEGEGRIFLQKKRPLKASL